MRILRRAFDRTMPGEGRFTALCKADQGIVAFGDDMAYCWRPVQEHES
ncbi:MAG: hypothetical protein U5K33_01120 [Halofilum sp. (in: g-proteobacteria)]|nr:hypothetical protein [Halofilum sp. (in: g-proteobacteria)]